MNAILTWWDLDPVDTAAGVPRGTTLAALRRDLEDSACRWRAVDGLAAKYWLRDDVANRWGAVMIWDHDTPSHRELPPNSASAIIGHPPTVRLEIPVVDAVIGRMDLNDSVTLTRTGVST